MTAARVTTSTEGETVHIAVSGEVDLGNTAGFESELRAAIVDQPRAVSVGRGLAVITILPMMLRCL
jgi:hypothetical protein